MSGFSQDYEYYHERRRHGRGSDNYYVTRLLLMALGLFIVAGISYNKVPDILPFSEITSDMSFSNIKRLEPRIRDNGVLIKDYKGAIFHSDLALHAAGSQVIWVCSSENSLNDAQAVENAITEIEAYCKKNHKFIKTEPSELGEIKLWRTNKDLLVTVQTVRKEDQITLTIILSR